MGYGWTFRDGDWKRLRGIIQKLASLKLGPDSSPTFTDITLTDPDNIYDLSHDEFADFLSTEHFLQSDITHITPTLSTGLVKVTDGTGELSTVPDNSTNWDTAFSWGNHAVAGYLTTISDQPIGELSDVNVSTAADGALLQYAVTTSTWEAVNVLSSYLTTISDSRIGDLSDVVVSTSADDAILQYDITTSTWESQSVLSTFLTTISDESIGDLSDVDLTDIANDAILQYNTTTSVWECEQTAIMAYGSMYMDNADFDVVVSAADVYYEVDGRMTSGPTSSMTFGGDHYLAPVYAGFYLVTYSMSILTESVANKTVEAAIMIDGSRQAAGSSHAEVSPGGSNRPETVNGSAIFELSAAAQISLAVSNHDDGTDLVIHHASITVIRVAELLSAAVTLSDYSVGDLGDVDLTSVADNKILQYDATASAFLCEDPPAGSSYILPSTRGDDYTTTSMVSYLESLHIKNQNIEFSACPFTHGATVAATGYISSIYAPALNRIYLIPSGQTTQSSWHYIDCNTGAVVAYTHGATVVAGAYQGAAFCPSMNRIYMAPVNQADQATWHYIDACTGAVTAYAHGATAVAVAYVGAAYSPVQDRIYFAPFFQANQANWHYVNCATGAVVAFAHGATAVSGAYIGACYSPNEDRLYFVPFGQADEANWHYVDCSDGSIVAYAHGVTAVDSAYAGAVYSPTQDRIYFVPYTQAPETNWHYIDCSDGTVHAYAHGATVQSLGYQGGTYSPANDRIYFAPFGQADQATWHYIDCSDGSVVGYSHGGSASDQGYAGATYSPRDNRIYFAPYAQSNQTTWHFIQEFSTAEIPASIAANGLFNKY